MAAPERQALCMPSTKVLLELTKQTACRYHGCDNWSTNGSHKLVEHMILDTSDNDPQALAEYAASWLLKHGKIR